MKIRYKDTDDVKRKHLGLMDDIKLCKLRKKLVRFRTFSKISDVYYYFASVRDAKYCDERVCMSVCPTAYLKNTSKLHEIFCTC